MSDFPASGVMTAPIPPGYGGASGAVNTPAPAFTTDGSGIAHIPARNDVIVQSAAEFPEHGLSADRAAQVLAVHYRLGSCQAGVPGPSTHYSARHEQRAAEQEQRVGDRWTVGWTVQRAEADAVRANEGAPVLLLPIPDAAKPTFTHPARRSPWWRWV